MPARCWTPASGAIRGTRITSVKPACGGAYWLVACEHPWGWFTVFSPALMTWSILGMMGKELVERRMLKKRPGYEDYVRRTSGFFPWPPRR